MNKRMKFASLGAGSTALVATVATWGKAAIVIASMAWATPLFIAVLAVIAGILIYAINPAKVLLGPPEDNSPASEGIYIPPTEISPQTT